MAGIRIVSLTTNIPGPLAAARLGVLGAAVTKIEPPAGDALESVAPRWYAQICANQTVVRFDLRSETGKAQLQTLLAQADLLISAMRATALVRLGLSWDGLQARFPRLCHVAVLGERAPFADRAGHDLTYQARAGLLSPPRLPKSVTADMLAAEQTVSAALSVLLQRECTGQAFRHDVTIADAAEALHASYEYGLTSPTGVLGGQSPYYNLYRSRDGWVALAALEPHFLERLPAALQIERIDADTLRERFAGKSSADWDAIAALHDIPLAALRDSQAGEPE
ncbi:MAG: CoA transferase [Candidatus Baltobacteraceae bacterium]